MTYDITYEQISGSLGSLLLLWAKIERQAREEVVRTHYGRLPKSAYGIAAVLNAWETNVVAGASPGSLRGLLASTLRAQLQETLNVRNGLCHGLIGFSSAHDGKPAALVWEINDLTCSITWDELQANFRWLCKVPFAISMISNSPEGKSGIRMNDSSEDRGWWLDEFGIKLAP